MEILQIWFHKISEYCSKASHNFFGFPVHIKVIFTLQYSLLSVILYKKCAYPNLKYFIAKKC